MQDFNHCMGGTMQKEPHAFLLEEGVWSLLDVIG